MNPLHGKVATITGGNSGIDLATTRLFIEAGARVAIIGRNKERLDAAAAETGALASDAYQAVAQHRFKGAVHTGVIVQAISTRES